MIRQGTYSVLSLVIPLAVGLATVPQIIEALGVTRFGLLTLAWAIVGYVSILDLGIPRAMTARIAAGNATPIKTRKAAHVGLVLLAALGILLALLIALISRTIPTRFHVEQTEYVQSSLWLSACVPFVFISSGLRGILEGHHCFLSTSLARLFFGLVTFGTPILVLPIAPSLDAMLAILFSGRVIGTLFLAAVSMPYIREPLSAKDIIPEAKSLLSFGSWMAAGNLISSILVYADRFVLASSKISGELAYYTTSYEFISKLLVVPSAFSSVLFPRMIEKSNGDHKDELFLSNGIAITAGMLAPITIGVGLFSYEVIAYWINASFAEKAGTPLLILSSGILINSTAQITQAHLLASSEAKWMARLQAVEAIIYIPIIFIAVNLWGLSGLSACCSIRSLVDAAALLSRCRKNTSTHDMARACAIHFFVLLCAIAPILASQMNYPARLTILLGAILSSAYLVTLVTRSKSIRKTSRSDRNFQKSFKN